MCFKTHCFSSVDYTVQRDHISKIIIVIIITTREPPSLELWQTFRSSPGSVSHRVLWVKIHIHLPRSCHLYFARAPGLFQPLFGKRNSKLGVRYIPCSCVYNAPFDMSKHAGSSCFDRLQGLGLSRDMI